MTSTPQPGTEFDPVWAQDFVRATARDGASPPAPGRLDLSTLPDGVSATFTFECPFGCTVHVIDGQEHPHDCAGVAIVAERLPHTRGCVAHTQAGGRELCADTRRKHAAPIVEELMPLVRQLKGTWWENGVRAGREGLCAVVDEHILEPEGESPADAYKPEVRAHLEQVRAIVRRIDYRGGGYLAYRFRVDVDVTDPDGRVFVQLQHLRPDAVTGQLAWGAGGKSYLSPHMTPSEIVRRCLGAAIAYEEHEVREFFRYAPADWPAAAEPVAVFGPHIDVDALADVAHRLDVRP